MRSTIFIVEDWAGSLWLETKRLWQRREFRVVGIATTASTALTAIERCRPQLVLLDMELSRQTLLTARTIRERWPAIEVLIASAFASEAVAIEALKAGANGYLLKQEDPAPMLEAMRALLAGGSVVEPKLARGVWRQLSGCAQEERQLRPPAASHIQPGAISCSNRELELLRSVARGNTTQEVAELFGISRETVRDHLHHIYKKLGVHNRIAAIREGLRAGLLQRESLG